MVRRSRFLTGHWDESSPQRAWDFRFLSPSVVRSIISQVGTQAGETAVYWKYGVWFYDATTRASALIEQQMHDDRRGRIVLSAQGDRSRELLDTVTKWIGHSIERDGGVRDVGSDAEDRGIGILPVSHAQPSCNKDDRLEAHPTAPDPAATLRITDPPRPSDERRACVSYAWKEERSSDPQRAGKVSEFCTKLEAVGVSIVRDTTALALGDRLSAFMRQIGHSDCVYIFLSDAYLKSPNCMYELLTIWQTSGDDPEKFRERTRVFFMPGTDVFSMAARLKYAVYWKKLRDEAQELIKDGGVDILGPTDLKHFKQIQDFAHHVNEMLAQIVDVLQPSAFDEFIDLAIDQLGL